MQGAPSTWWGKLDRDPSAGSVEWHPLVDHCADVAACFEALLAQPVIRRRLASTGGLRDLSTAQVQRLSALAFLHDLGKVNTGFQRRSDPAAPPVGHVGQAASLLAPGQQVLDTALSGLDLDGWAEDSRTVKRLLLASISHHGRPAATQAMPSMNVWQPIGRLDPVDGLNLLARHAAECFPQALLSGAEPLPDAPPFQHAFSGLVMLADWLGSDTRFFPFSEPNGGPRMPRSRQWARDALRAIHIDAEAARAVLQPDLPGFGEVFLGLEANDIQRSVEELHWSSLASESAGTLAFLEAETGSGKTEAALRYYLHLFHRGVVDGLYFALPTRSAASQIHRRVLETLTRTFGDAAPPVVLAVPGYLRVDDHEGVRLPPFQVLWRDGSSDPAFRRGWSAEHPKRFLAAPVAIGTVDQILLSALQTNHAQMRASSLHRLLLVVDEVHASDTYMASLLEAVLQHHVNQAGGQALLMSATLGSSLRCRLQDRRPVPTLRDACQVPYPLLQIGSAGTEPVLYPVESHPDRAKTVQVELAGRDEFDANLPAQLLAAARKGARILVIRNRVADAVATQRLLESVGAGEGTDFLFNIAGVPAVHHSRFSPDDRRLLDQAMEDRFGKDSSGAVLAVATQTVEQSLDIDADLLVTDLCPMDVLLQRLGRLHRHRGRRRHPDFAEPGVLVLVPAGLSSLGGFLNGKGDARGPAGLGSVYRDLLCLEATWKLLVRYPRLEIPSMNRMLVEETTHPEALDGLAKRLGGSWLAHRQSILGQGFAAGGLARLNIIRRSMPFGSSDICFGDDDKNLEVTTRLGDRDWMVRFDPSPAGPFGRPVHQLRIPGWMVPKADVAEQPDTEVLPEGGFLFELQGHRFLYDRMGLQQQAVER